MGDEPRPRQAPAPHQEPPDREYIAGLEKGLAVLELFGHRCPQMTPMQAAKLTGLPRATARRCLRTLEKLGYLTFDGKHYGLTSRVLRLGHAYFESTPLAKVVQPVLESLAQRTGESAALAILDGADAVFLARASLNTSFSGSIGVGVRASAYNTATGRALLAALDKAQVEQLMQNSPPRRLTPHSVVDPKALLRAIAEARRRGYAICDEEVQLGSRSIAVAIVDASGNAIAAMSLAVHAGRIGAEDMPAALLPHLESARRMLASAL
ncbi:MAG: IclR family transcriptional regulator [Ramlibacter sp.]|nr:IclR family transcriptional regulator [Ramlibacter sp.]